MVSAGATPTTPRDSQSHPWAEGLPAIRKLSSCQAWLCLALHDINLEFKVLKRRYFLQRCSSFSTFKRPFRFRCEHSAKKKKIQTKRISVSGGRRLCLFPAWSLTEAPFSPNLLDIRSFFEKSTIPDIGSVTWFSNRWVLLSMIRFHRSVSGPRIFNAFWEFQKFQQDQLKVEY